MTELIAKCVFEAIKVAWRQSKDGYNLTLVVHPSDVPDEIALSPIGTRYHVGISRADEQAVVTDSRAVQAAGALCRNAMFHNFLRARGYSSVTNEPTAAAALRDILGVDSRSQIGGVSAEKMMELTNEFRRWYASAPTGAAIQAGGSRVDEDPYF